VFEVTERGDVFVDARLYDWRTKVFMLGAPSRAYGRVAGLVVNDSTRRVLDVGTGTGAMAFALKQRRPAAEVHGIDAGERMLDVARTNGVRLGHVVHFRPGWAQDLPFANEEFDAVTFAHVLRHIPVPQRPAVLAEARRVLRPGGRVLIVDIVPAGLAVAFAPRRAYPLDLDGCTQMLKAAGFTDVRAGRLTRVLFGYAVGRRPGRVPG
jgi:ubiquinone/menaquinone biosynthesis C-methylase UbiE